MFAKGLFSFWILEKTMSCQIILHQTIIILYANIHLWIISSFRWQDIWNHIWVILVLLWLSENWVHFLGLVLIGFQNKIRATLGQFRTQIWQQSIWILEHEITLLEHYEFYHTHSIVTIQEIRHKNGQISFHFPSHFPWSCELIQ